MLIIDAKDVKPDFLQYLEADDRKKIKEYSVLYINDSQWFFVSKNVLKPKDPQHINPNWVMAGLDQNLNPVAIKFQTIPENDAIKPFKNQLFERERVLTQRIPDYCLAAGESTDGKLHYLVLNFLPGNPLYNSASSAKFEWFNPADISSQDKIDIVAASIQKLHDFHFSYNLEHRDLYGDNVLVHRSEEGWEVNFIDLGLGAEVTPGTLKSRDIEGDKIWAAIHAIAKNRDPRPYLTKQELNLFTKDINLLLNHALLSGLNIKPETEPHLYEILVRFKNHPIDPKVGYTKFLEQLATLRHTKQKRLKRD